MCSAEDHGARGDPGPVFYRDRSSKEGHVSTVGVATGGEEGLLRDNDVVTDVDVVLVVEPDALAYPGVRADVEFPGKLHSGARAKHHSVANLGAEHSEHAHSKARTDLPRIGDEEQFRNGPGVHDGPGAIPRGSFSGGIR